MKKNYLFDVDGLLQVLQAIKEGKITLEEGKEFLDTYRSGLYGYTYLE